MNLKIIEDWSLEESLESDWYELVDGKKKLVCESMQLYWLGLNDGFDGYFDLLASADKISVAASKRIYTNSESTINDALLFFINSRIKFLKIKYIKNTNTGGTFSATLTWRENGY